MEENDATIKERTNETSQYRNMVEENKRQINTLTQKVESVDNINKATMAESAEREVKVAEKEKENDMLRKKVEEKDGIIIDRNKEIALYRKETEEGKKQMKALTQETNRTNGINETIKAEN